MAVPPARLAGMDDSGMKRASGQRIGDDAAPAGSAEPPQDNGALARQALDTGQSALMAGDNALARMWLDRAHRLVPADANVMLALASACVMAEPARAASLFDQVARAHDNAQAWLGLAVCRWRIGDTDGALAALSRLLSGHALPAAAAGLIGPITAATGWCGLHTSGRLEVQPPAGFAGRLVIRLDGRVLHDTALPADWRQATTITVSAGGRMLTGSPIRIDAIRRVCGCVEPHDGGLRGWAWHPADPDTDPVLTLYWPALRLRRRIVATDQSQYVPDTGPLARPRSFLLTRQDLLAVADGRKPAPKGLTSDLTMELTGGLAGDLTKVSPGRSAKASPKVSPSGSTGKSTSGAEGPGLVHILTADGRPLLGSPLDPAALLSAGARTAASGAVSAPAPRAKRSRPAPASRAAPAPASVSSPVATEPVGADGRHRGVTVVVPVHNGFATVRACLRSVLATLDRDVRLLVVDDGSTDKALIAWLDELHAQGKIGLRRHAAAQGFPAAANAGMRAARGTDVVLLNSDTLVPPDWLGRLRRAAYLARDIGTVTPFSNDASILSYPAAAEQNPRPDAAGVRRLDRLARLAHDGAVVDIPVGVGFCLYIRRDCLNAVGMFRHEIFAQGYGEENDFCLRARHLGWRNVALPGLFVGHVGGASFGESARHLRARNARILEQLHPGHDALIVGWIARDPLAEARRRLDLQRWRLQRAAGAAILVTHDEGGGVEARIAESARAHAAAGRRAIVLRPVRAAPSGNGEGADTSAAAGSSARAAGGGLSRTAGGDTSRSSAGGSSRAAGGGLSRAAGGDFSVSVNDGPDGDFVNLVFALPSETDALLALLRDARPVVIELHHLAGYGSAFFALLEQLDAPTEAFIHDYAWFCPRVLLVAQDHYCGEPDLAGCEACIAEHGHFLAESGTVAALRARSGRYLSAARRVIVPSEDTGARMRRHFPGLRTVTVPHEDDAGMQPWASMLPSPGTPRSPSTPRSSSTPPGSSTPLWPSTPPGSARRAADQAGGVRVCVVGGIGLHKGYDVLLACARDAAGRGLALDFIIVGSTIGDAALMATGRVFITGRFAPSEAVALIRAQNADLGFVPSVCPETWCLALGEIWRAGLAACAFDFGAPAERIRGTGRGFVLPVGLSPPAINDALIRIAKTGREQLPTVAVSDQS